MTNTRGLAYINHGRWLADCPNCGSAVLIDPEKGQAVCGFCYPEILSTCFVKRVRADGTEVYDPAPDTERRAAAMKKATPFKFVLPKDWKRIFETLRPRNVSFMNWLPGESLESLQAANIRNGLTARKR